SADLHTGAATYEEPARATRRPGRIPRCRSDGRGAGAPRRRRRLRPEQRGHARRTPRQAQLHQPAREHRDVGPESRRHGHALEADDSLRGESDARGAEQGIDQARRHPEGGHPPGEERQSGRIHPQPHARRQPRDQAVLRRRARLADPKVRTTLGRVSMVDRRTLVTGVFVAAAAIGMAAQGPGGGRGGRGGGGIFGASPFTPEPGARDIKSVLFNWTWHMGMLRSGEEAELIKTLDYYGESGTIQVNGQSCVLSKY